MEETDLGFHESQEAGGHSVRGRRRWPLGAPETLSQCMPAEKPPKSRKRPTRKVTGTHQSSHRAENGA